jgi:hypothetical protein
MSTSVANTTSAIPNTVDTATNSSTPEANDPKGTDSGPEPASSTASGTGTGSAAVTSSLGTPPPVIIPFNYMEFFGAFQTLICVFIMVAILYKIFISFVKLI